MLPHLHAQYCGTGRGLEAHRAAGTPPCAWCLEAAGLYPGLVDELEKRASAAEKHAIAAREDARRAEDRAAAAEGRLGESEERAAAAERLAGEAHVRASAAEERARRAEAPAPPPEPVTASPGVPASVAEYAAAVLADEGLLGALGDVTAAAARARALMARHDQALGALAGMEGVSLTPAGVTDGEVRVSRFRSAALLHAALEGRQEIVRQAWRDAVTDG